MSGAYPQTLQPHCRGIPVLRSEKPQIKLFLLDFLKFFKGSVGIFPLHVQTVLN